MLTLVGKVDHAKTASMLFYGDLKKLRISSDLAEVLLLQATKVGVMENINGQYFFHSRLTETTLRRTISAWQPLENFSQRQSVNQSSEPSSAYFSIVVVDSFYRQFS